MPKDLLTIVLCIVRLHFLQQNLTVSVYRKNKLLVRTIIYKKDLTHSSLAFMRLASGLGDISSLMDNLCSNSVHSSNFVLFEKIQKKNFEMMTSLQVFFY